MDSLQSLDIPSTSSLNIGSEFKTGLCVVEHIARQTQQGLEQYFSAHTFKLIQYRKTRWVKTGLPFWGPIGNPVTQHAISDLVQ
jgi:hypothetical protein